MKTELKNQYLDEWMLRWRKFQTESDWHIEKNRQWWRKVNMAIAFAVGSSLTIYSSGNATIRRQFGPPHFFDIGLDVYIKQQVCKVMTSTWRFTPQGYSRLLFVGAPTYLSFIGMEHMQEGRRLRAYLRQQTVFGEQARRLVETGKIEEYLPVNIQATLPHKEKYLYA